MSAVWDHPLDPPHREHHVDNVRPIRPTVYDRQQEPTRSDDTVTLTRAQAGVIVGLLAESVRSGTPWVGQTNEAMSWLSCHPSLMGPRGGA